MLTEEDEYTAKLRTHDSLFRYSSLSRRLGHTTSQLPGDTLTRKIPFGLVKTRP